MRYLFNYVKRILFITILGVTVLLCLTSCGWNGRIVKQDTMEACARSFILALINNDAAALNELNKSNELLYPTNQLIKEVAPVYKNSSIDDFIFTVDNKQGYVTVASKNSNNSKIKDIKLEIKKTGDKYYFYNLIATQSISKNTANSEENIKPNTTVKATVQPTVDILSTDSSSHPFLKFTATNKVVSNVTKYSKVQTFSELKEKGYVTDVNELEFIKKGMTINSIKPYEIGNFIMYSVMYQGNQTFLISKKGETIDKAFCALTKDLHGGAHLEKGLLSNSKGDFLLAYFNTLYYIESNSTNIKCSRIGDYLFSENTKFIAGSIKTNEAMTYKLINLENLSSAVISIPISNFSGSMYSIDNFIITDDGAFALSQGMYGGVADKWAEGDKYTKIIYTAYVSGFNSKNTYLANFQGNPLYLSNEYLIFTDKYALKKVSKTGTDVLKKYVDFEKQYYSMILKPCLLTNSLKSDEAIIKRGSQCIFSSNSVFDNNTPVYLFDYKTLTFSNGKYDLKNNKFVSE